MIIEHINPAELSPNERNSRLHSDDQIRDIARSIREFGWTAPIVIDEHSVILAGHGRQRAALHLGQATVPCHRISGLTAAQKRAYVIADNSLSEGSQWDINTLMAEVAALTSDGYDLTALGIDVATLLDQPSAPTTAADLQALELRTDNAPTTDAAFTAELANKTTPGLAPIVPMYAEHHQAFVIVCDNEIDEAFLRQRLGLNTPMASYKDSKILRANVITVDQLRAAITGAAA